MLLKTKFILSSVLGLAVVLSLGVWFLNRLQARYFEREMTSHAELVQAFGEACRSYTKEILRPEVSELTDSFIVEAMSGTYLTTGVFGFLNEKFPDYQHRQPTLNPLNTKNLADEYEAKMIKAFAADNTLEVTKGYREMSDGQEQFYVARPVVVEAKCLSCHGNPDDAPEALVQQYGRDHGFGWKEREVAGLLMVSVPAGELSLVQQATMRIILGTFVGMLLLITLIIFICFKKIIDHRIHTVSCIMTQVAKDPYTSVRIEDTQNDEISVIAKVFNGTADSLRDSLDMLEYRVKERTFELEEALQRAGMAEEVAANMLHNIGNVLNTVSLSTSLVLEHVRDSEIMNLKKIAELLDGHPSDMAEFIAEDEKGKCIPAYLSEVCKGLGEEQDSLLEITETLSKSVEHIVDIIHSQQSFEGGAKFEIATCISSLVSDTVEVCRKELEQLGIELTYEVDDLPEMMISKHQIQKILVNLISNAKHSILKQTSGIQRLIHLACYQEQDCLCIEVQDDGVGVAKEDLVRIFQHGFTTKKNGRGFGLHSAALAAKEMGGAINVDSEGVGMGATFTLELPMKLVGATEC